METSQAEGMRIRLVNLKRLFLFLPWYLRILIQSDDLYLNLDPLDIESRVF